MTRGKISDPLHFPVSNYSSSARFLKPSIKP
jgi:hypothetical protein